MHHTSTLALTLSRVGKVAALAAGLFCLGTSAIAQTVYGITGCNQLVTSDPGRVCSASPVAITGVASGQVLAAIDCRPSTGQLYGLAYSRATGLSQLYIINPTTSVATAVGAANRLALAAAATGGSCGGGFSQSGQLTGVGFDFNPVSGEIRVVSEATAKNYRLNPTTGAIVSTDANVFYPSFRCISPRVHSIAHTNSYGTPGATLLGAMDGYYNRLGTIDPPNTGQFNSYCPPRNFPCLASVIDFDIYYNPSNTSNTVYIARQNFFWTELMTCDISLTGLQSKGFYRFGVCISDIAIAIIPPVTPPNPPVPPTPVANSRVVYALSANGSTLVSFKSDAPGTLLSSVTLSGVAASQTIVGMDINPKTGQLYILGFNQGGGVASTWNVDPATGVCTRVNPASFSVALGSGRNIGFDYNPATDRIRAVSTNDKNYRLNPFTGLVDSVDGNLNFAVGDGNYGVNPSIGSIAYTNKRAIATGTRCYAFNDSTSCLVYFSDERNGVLSNVGWTGYYFDTQDGGVDIDIYTDTLGVNYGYSSGIVHGEPSTRFFNVDLTTGKFISVGIIGDGSVKYREIAVTPDRRRDGTIARTVAAPKPAALLYPNPATGQNVVELALSHLPSGTYEMVMVDRFGMRVTSETFTSSIEHAVTTLKMDVGHLNTGIYNVVILNNGRVVAQTKMAK